MTAHRTIRQRSQPEKNPRIALAERAMGLYVERALRNAPGRICQAFYGFMADPADPRQRRKMHGKACARLPGEP